MLYRGVNNTRMITALQAEVAITEIFSRHELAVGKGKENPETNSTYSHRFIPEIFSWLIH